MLGFTNFCLNCSERQNGRDCKSPFTSVLSDCPNATTRLHCTSREEIHLNIDNILDRGLLLMNAGPGIGVSGEFWMKRDLKTGRKIESCNTTKRIFFRLPVCFEFSGSGDVFLNRIKCRLIVIFVHAIDCGSKTLFDCHV